MKTIFRKTRTRERETGQSSSCCSRQDRRHGRWLVAVRGKEKHKVERSPDFSMESNLHILLKLSLYFQSPSRFTENRVDFIGFRPLSASLRKTEGIQDGGVALHQAISILFSAVWNGKTVGVPFRSPKLLHRQTDESSLNPLL